VTIDEFIKARIDELEEAASVAIELEQLAHVDGYEFEYQWARFRHRPRSSTNLGSMFVPGAPTPREVLRQCAAFRMLMDLVDGVVSESPFLTGKQWMDLYKPTAAIWSSHKDFKQEWVA
jgi:hypothetical protein